MLSTRLTWNYCSEETHTHTPIYANLMGINLKTASVDIECCCWSSSLISFNKHLHFECETRNTLSTLKIVVVIAKVIEDCGPCQKALRYPSGHFLLPQYLIDRKYGGGFYEVIGSLTLCLKGEICHISIQHTQLCLT